MTNANGKNHISAMNGDKEKVSSNGYYYLTNHACQSLPKFQYKGEDRSLLYAYILSPLAAFLVQNCTPKWMAPNSVTLSGLMYMIASYLLIWHYVPNLDVANSISLPGWIFAYHSAAILIYQTLDNMDGKQARRTGSSSPLGLLFDHGCDAINSIFGSVNWIISLGLNPQRDALMCWGIILGPMAMFYVSTWEEYFTGELILPIVNGPNEGLVGGALLSLTTAIYGPAFWQSTSFSDAVPFLPRFRNSDIQVAIACFGFLQEILLKANMVARKYGKKTLLNLLPFALLLFSTLLIGYLDLEIWLRMPRTSVHLCSGLFVEMTTQIMLDHITEEIYQPFRWTLLPMLLLLVLVGTTQLSAGTSTDHYILVYASALWTYLFWKIKLVIHEICSVLSIWCFDIITPRSKQKER